METVRQDLKNSIRLLCQEVSSVKSVVISFLKEMLEKRYQAAPSHSLEASIALYPLPLSAPNEIIASSLKV